MKKILASILTFIMAFSLVGGISSFALSEGKAGNLFGDDISQECIAKWDAYQEALTDREGLMDAACKKFKEFVVTCKGETFFKKFFSKAPIELMLKYCDLVSKVEEQLSSTENSLSSLEKSLSSLNNMGGNSRAYSR